MSKKNAGKKNDDDGPDPNRINTALKAECDMLQRQIVTEQERQDKAKSNENDLRDRVIELDSEFTEKREETRKIVDDMKRQYQTMQDDLMGQIVKLEKQVDDNEADIKNKDDQIFLLDQEIKEE